MADANSPDGRSQILELRIGRGEPSSMLLVQGTVVDPTSVGTAGMWRLEGQGVLDVHGYIYFDGKSLYVQSADDKTPILVNKHRVATAWTEVRAPSTIELGKAELVYRDSVVAAYDDGDETVAAAQGPKPTPPPPAFVPGGGAFANRADDESTRFAPIEGMPMQAQAPRPNEATRLDPLEGPSTNRAPLARPAAGNPAMAFPPPQMDMPDQPMPMMGMQGMQGMPPGMQGMPPGMQGMPPGMQGMQGMPPGMQGMHGMQGMPGMQGMQGAPGMPGWNGAMQTGPQATMPGQALPGAEKKGLEKFKAEWEVLPPMRRALYIMAPFVFSAACFLLFFDDEGPVQVTRPKGAPSTSASTMGMGSGAAGMNSAPTGTGTDPNTGTGAMTSTAMTGAAVTVAPTASTAPAVTSATAPVKTAEPASTKEVSPALAAPPAAPGKRTSERLAADAWAEGNYAEAAKMYDELAAQNPGNPAYKEAARILREKMSAPSGR